MTTSNGLERQIKRISDKAKLQELIDSLPEDSIALIVTEEPCPDAPDDSIHHYTAFGDVSIRDALWLATHAQHYFMNWSKGDG